MLQKYRRQTYASKCAFDIFLLVGQFFVRLAMTFTSLFYKQNFHLKTKEKVKTFVRFHLFLNSYGFDCSLFKNLRFPVVIERSMFQEARLIL